ncbi:MAG: serine hydrolase domain-containing protein [Pseudomonadota bacterium]
MVLSQEAIEDILRETASACAMPGAQLCVSLGEEVFFAQIGFANLATQMPVTPTTRFQLASTTKPMIAYLAHQLTAEGLLDLARPVYEYLIGDERADWLKGSPITTQMLLSHTSGLCGDAFLDLGSGREAEAALVEKIGKIAVLHAPGEDTSYCNVGFVLCGYLLEAVSGQHWTRLFRDRIAYELGSSTLDPWPDEHAQDLAIGHSGDVPVQRSALSISNAAAGTTLVGTAEDLCGFGRLVLDGLQGRGVLKSEDAISMTSLVAPLAPNERGLGFGHGMMVFSEAPFVFGHDGLTIGQQSYLRVFPETDICVAFLGNGGDMRAASRQIFEALAPISGSMLELPRYERGGLAPLEGRYDRNNASLLIEQSGDGATLSVLNHERWAIDLYGAIEGPYEIVMLPNGGYGFYKADSDFPYRLHVTEHAAYFGMRRYNRVHGGGL